MLRLFYTHYIQNIINYEKIPIDHIFTFLQMKWYKLTDHKNQIDLELTFNSGQVFNFIRTFEDENSKSKENSQQNEFSNHSQINTKITREMQYHHNSDKSTCKKLKVDNIQNIQSKTCQNILNNELHLHEQQYTSMSSKNEYEIIDEWTGIAYDCCYVFQQRSDNHIYFSILDEIENSKIMKKQIMKTILNENEENNQINQENNYSSKYNTTDNSLIYEYHKTILRNFFSLNIDYNRIVINWIKRIKKSNFTIEQKIRVFEMLNKSSFFKIIKNNQQNELNKKHQNKNVSQKINRKTNDIKENLSHYDLAKFDYTFTSNNQYNHNESEKLNDELHALEKQILSNLHNFSGLRLLKPALLETIFSFLCSQNNNIKNIKKMVHSLYKLGTFYCRYGNFDFHHFPSLKNILKSTETELPLGYRKKYVLDSAQTLLKDIKKTKNNFYGREHDKKNDHFDDIYNSTIDFDQCISSFLFNPIKQNSINSIFKNHTYLMFSNYLKTLHGISDKVADCISLYAGGYTFIAPVDVHIFKLSKELFFEKLLINKKRQIKIKKTIDEIVLNRKNIEIIKKSFFELFGVYSGLAQLFLFDRSVKERKKIKN